MTELTAAQKDKLMADLRVVINDAEELLKLTAGDVSDSAVGLRERLQRRREVIPIHADPAHGVRA